MDERNMSESENGVVHYRLVAEQSQFTAQRSPRAYSPHSATTL